MEVSISLHHQQINQRQKININLDVLNNTIDQLDLIDIYKIFYSIVEYTLFSSSHGMFTRIDHTLFHKMYLNEFKMIEIIQNTFLDHNRIKLEVKKRKRAGNSPYIWKLNNTCWGEPQRDVKSI